jgi:hypothetical protein
MNASDEPRMVATSTHLPFAGVHGAALPDICAQGSAPGDFAIALTTASTLKPIPTIGPGRKPFAETCQFTPSNLLTLK